MLSLRKISAGNSAAAAKYFTQYYSEKNGEKNGEPPGKWIAGGRGEVTAAQLQNVFEGRDKSGKMLVKTAENKPHAPGWDLTFSAPKSVSTAWAVADKDLQEAIAKAHSQACKKALDYLQLNAFSTRHGRAGKDAKKRLNGKQIKMFCAEFEHSTSRANDPELHSHIVVANLAQTSDNKFRCLEFNARKKMTAGALYRCNLAQSLKEMGYNIEAGAKGSFEIQGINEELRAQWSKRSAQIQEAVGADASAKAKAAAAVKTRHGKEVPDREKNFEKWREEAAVLGVTAETVKELRNKETDAPKQLVEDAEVIKKCLKNGIACREESIDAQCLSDAAGVTDAKTAFERAETIKNSMIQLTKKENGHNVTFYTTLEMIATEVQLAENAKILHETKTHEIKNSNIEAAKSLKTLSKDQEKMLEHCCKAESVAVCQGYAGSGKSYALDAVRDAHERQGYKVVGCAPSAKAAVGLEESSSIKSQTLAQLLIDLKREKTNLDEKTVVVVDEAGMVGSRDMYKLVKCVQDAGAKMILVGDERQLAPVESGAPFSDMKARFGYAELTQVRRQKDEKDVEIANLLRNGEAATAKKEMLEKKAWHVAKTTEKAINEIAKTYAKDRLNGLEAACFSGLRADVNAINTQAREILQTEKFIQGPEITVKLADGTNLNLQVNDRIIFTKNDKANGLKNGEIADVVSVDETNKTATLKIHGDKGKLITVQGLTNDKEQDAKQTGYNMLYGHAMTVHKSQGATIKQTEVTLEDGTKAKKGGNSYAFFSDNCMTNSNLAYVAGSRNEGEFHVFCTKDDEEKMLQRASEEQDTDSLRKYNKLQASILNEAKKFDLTAPAASASMPEPEAAEEREPEITVTTAPEAAFTVPEQHEVAASLPPEPAPTPETMPPEPQGWYDTQRADLFDKEEPDFVREWEEEEFSNSCIFAESQQNDIDSLFFESEWHDLQQQIQYNAIKEQREIDRAAACAEEEEMEMSR